MVLISLQLMLIRQRAEGVAFDMGQQKSQRLQRTNSFALELKSTPQIR